MSESMSDYSICFICDVIKKCVVVCKEVMQLSIISKTMIGVVLCVWMTLRDDDGLR